MDLTRTETRMLPYPFRAKVAHAEFAFAMAEALRELTYSNFKSRVAKTLGSARAKVYSEVWSSLHALSAEVASTTAASAPAGKAAAFGGVLLREDGCILLRRPKGDFDGYVWTFAKGKAAPGESPEQTALREVRDETGYEARIVGELPGWFESGLSATRFFMMRPLEKVDEWDEETEAIEWVPLEEADAWIAKTRNAKGRARDQKVLVAVRRYQRGG